MVTQKELEDAINELGAATKKFSNIITETGNIELILAWREHAIKGLYHFCQECSLITTGLELEDIE